MSDATNESQACLVCLMLMQSGLLDLHQFQPTEFDLVHANDAVAHAAVTAGAFHLTILRP